MTVNYYQDYMKTQELNKLSISQKAKVTPDPSMLHLIQLLVWGLQSGQIISMEKGRESPAKTHFLLGVAEKLLYEVEPQRAMDLLLKEGPDEGEPEETWVDLKELDKVEDPTKAALMLAEEGIPEPKPGLVSEAHGGILFIDEIGEIDAALQNKLLKVLEDKRVTFESAYYDPHNERIPRYIKQMFEQGVPADFVLIGATTRGPEAINPALRSRCMEVYFEALKPEDIQKIVSLAAEKLDIRIQEGVKELISYYADDGRSANKILVEAYSIALNKEQAEVSTDEVYEAISNSRIVLSVENKASDHLEVGKIFGLGAYGYRGRLLEIEAVAFPADAPGQGRVRFNETAGSMARDSVFNAASVIRGQFGESIYNYDLHINFIGGGKVDGPSAGAAIYLAILSAIKGIAIRQDIAVSGEISIRGRVKAVGGLHEKIQAARQAGVKKVLIPYDNREDLKSKEMGLEIIPIAFIQEAYPHVLEDSPTANPIPSSEGERLN
jgi:ATP-dependent Lon protease